MRSGTSCFNLALWRKAISRFWPLWAINLVIWLLALPVRGLMLLRNDMVHGQPGMLERFAQRLAANTSIAGVLLAAVLGLLVAMAMFSYLYHARSANFMGMLPVRRQGVFFSHYLAGLVMLLAPNVLAFLLTAAVEAAGGVLLWQPLLVWLGTQCGAELFFYSFAVLLGMFTGHILALPVFYMVFNGIVAAFYYLITWIMSEFFYGYASQASWEWAVEWLTPLWRMLDRIAYEPYGDTSLSFYGADLRVVAIYAGAGVLFTALAALLCWRRQLERAGDVVAVAALRPVFKYGVALCAGLFFGYLTSQLLNTGSIGLMIAIVLWGAAGYFVAQMFLSKSFRVLRHFPGALGVMAVFAALFLLVGLDLTGYETRVPDAAAVAQVRISGLALDEVYDTGSYLDLVLTEPEQIQRVTALHQAVVDHRRREGDDYARTYGPVNLCYTMKNGGTLVRDYYIGVDPDAVGQEGSVAYAVERLRQDRGIAALAYGLDRIAQFEAQGGRLLWVRWDDAQQSYELYGEDAQALYDAVLEDFAQGTIGLHSLTETGDASLRLYFLWEWAGGAEEALEIAVLPTSAHTRDALSVYMAD